MALSTLQALLQSFILLLVLVLPHVHAKNNNDIHPIPIWRRRKSPLMPSKHHKPRFKPGPWKNAHATFYGGPDGSGTMRKVPCNKKGGIRFTVSGNPYFFTVLVWNVGGAGDVVGMQVKGDDKVKWTPMQRGWGQKWQTNSPLAGESLTFRVRASDGRTSTSWHVVPKAWQFGQTFEGKNFK
ncbi:hypothetical protein U1Q18_008297 [Sarracenia purpurea var. burkii]